MTDGYDDTFKHWSTSDLFKLCKGHELITGAYSSSCGEGAACEMSRSLLFRKVIVEELGLRDEINAERISPHAESIETDEDMLVLIYRNNPNAFEARSPDIQVGGCSTASGQFDAIIIDIASRRPKKS